jgi:acylphosphatase
MGDVVRRVTVQGVVQGVGYRVWVERKAIARGLEGWVRNRRDGSVEAVFAGTAQAVADMIASCRKGPPMAEVDKVDDTPDDSEALKLRPAGERFSLLPTV